MEFNHILNVIDELGKALKDKDTKIKFQEYEIERLKKKIESIEQYVDFYSKE